MAPVSAHVASTSTPLRHGVLRAHVHSTTYEDATQRIIDWAQARSSRYICVANVHVVMEAYDDPAFASVVNEADLVTPDGMPLVWTLRLMHVSNATRVYGPDLMLAVCDAAAAEGLPVALYGGTQQTLDALVNRLSARYPDLRIVCVIAPPFRPLTESERQAHLDQLRASGARIVFVGLGCPKQERWMAQHRGQLPAVAIGVGAAFDFHAGRVRQAPSWMQRMGLEWVFRLAMEPRRLWRRYAWHNPRFVFLVARQFLVSRLRPPPKAAS